MYADALGLFLIVACIPIETPLETINFFHFHVVIKWRQLPVKDRYACLLLSMLESYLMQAVVGPL